VTRSTATDTASPTAMRALRIAATAAVVVIVLQGVTAGEILSRSRVAETLHFAGAFAVHICTGLTALAAFLLARRRRASWWPTGIAVAVFVVSFVQAALGDLGVLSVHVPLAMLLLVGSAVVMAWSYARPSI
jgi:uncharacterized membrane protein